MLGGQLNITFMFVVPDGYGVVGNNCTSSSSALSDVVAELPTPIKSTYSLTGMTVDTEQSFTQTCGNYAIAVNFIATDTTATVVFDHATKSVTIDGEESGFLGAFFDVKFNNQSATINASGATHTVSHEWNSRVI